MSSLASTIIPILSESSPITVAASPMETDQSLELPIESRIPLPASSTCSEDEGDASIDADLDDQIQAPQLVKAERKHEDIYLPLLPDVWTDKSTAKGAKTQVTEKPSISVNELARLVESEQYERRRGLFIRNGLEQVSFDFALNRRLIRSSKTAYRTLVDQFRAIDHGGFTSSYQAVETLKIDCDAIARPAQMHNNHTGENDLNSGNWEELPSSWLQRLPPAYQNGVLAFLTNIRTDKTFLSECLLGLTSLELTALTASHQQLAHDDSVFQTHFLSKIRAAGKDSQDKIGPHKAYTLRNFYQNDPYFLLLYALFDDSLKPDSQESLLRADIWSTACARILEAGKNGSDEFAVITLDTFAGFWEWKLKPKLEIFLMKVLHEGAFLLNPLQPADFKQPVELRNARAAVAISHFFDEALKELFELLANGPIQNAVPESALHFAHAVLGKIRDPRIRLRAKTFIISRWYFSSFISTILVYPESQGIMMGHHISDTARVSILKELANRMQKQVMDVTSPWNHMTLVTPDTQARVGQFIEVFEPPPKNSQTSQEQAQITENRDQYSYPSQLMLTPQDIICLMELLGPNLSVSPTTTDIESGKAPSTASSVTGSSTLTSGSTGHGSAMNSSMTPSTSGTSMASNVAIGNIPFVDSYIDGDDSRGSVPKDPGAAAIEMRNTPMIQLKDISDRIKEGLGIEEDSSSIKSTNDWAFIYISENGKKLALEPPGDNKNLRQHVPSIDIEDILAIDTNRLYVSSLKEAIIKLMADRHFFHDILQKIGAEIAASPNISLVLESLFEMAMCTCQDNLEFEDSFFWWNSIQSLRQLMSTVSSQDFETALDAVIQDLHSSLESQLKTTEQNLTWQYSLDIARQSQNAQLQELRRTRSALRIKMWYVSDVRHSAPYEDTLHVTRALRAMASSRTKQPSGLTSWARHRLRNSFGHDRSDAQTLEAVTAHRDHGGLSKLADEQVELTSRWLTKFSIENFCKGEERIHRFCYEVQKCVNKLTGVNILDSPVLWASRLFEREKLAFDAKLPRSATYDLQHKNLNAPSDTWTQMRHTPPQTVFPHGASLDPPMLKSSYANPYPFKSWNSPSSSCIYNRSSSNHQPGFKDFVSSSCLSMSQNAASSGHWNSFSHDAIAEKKAFTQEVKKTLHSLVISDLGYLLWASGSETDAWINVQVHDSQILGKSESRMEANHDTTDRGDVTGRSGIPSSNRDSQEMQKIRIAFNSGNSTYCVRSLPIASGANSVVDAEHISRFPYHHVYKTLLDKFSYCSDPYTKLQTLTELETLVLSSTSNIPTKKTQAVESTASLDLSTNPAPTNSATSRIIKVPRTKATRLEEVIANCTERRAGTLKLSPSINKEFVNCVPDLSNSSLSNADSLISNLLQIFRDPSLRPPTLFRDLQYIAAFVPPSILDQTSQGKAFWDAGLAALALKEDLCSAMITRATQITTYHISPPSPTPDPALAHTSLEDAARLWLITAKEGSPVAARELGLFYLTHPNLLPRITLPFSKAKDIFRTTMAGDQAGGGGKGGPNGVESGGLDALTFAVVFHWMEIAANGGDRDARDFLRENVELNAGR